MRRIRTAAVLLVLLLGVASVAPASAASNRSERRHEADRCKNGGWQELTTAEGTPFGNQGQCVAYAQQGGQLTEPEPPDPGCDGVDTGPTDAAWELVLHMSDQGGMFDGEGELLPTYSWGTFVASPTASTPDFARVFPFPAEDIMFATGDGEVWAVTDHGQLRALIDARGGEFGTNLCFETSEGTTDGNVLSRPEVCDFRGCSNPEDPWISMNGDHLAGITTDRIVYGENDYFGPHVNLKNQHQGINVYIHA